MKEKLSAVITAVLLLLLCSANLAHAQPSALDLGTASQVRNSIIFQNPYATPVSEGVSVRFSASDSVLPAGHYNVLLSGTPFSQGFRIDMNSLVFNRGSSAYLGAADTLDLDFNPRVACQKLDIGAFEHPVLPTQIITQPVHHHVCQGENVLLSVEVVGEGLIFQWQRNGVDLAGGTGSTLALSNVQITDTGYYRVIVTSMCYEVTSIPVRLDVDLRPVLVTMNDTTIISGESVTLYTVEPTTGTVYWFESDRVTSVINPVTNITATRQFFARATNGVCTDTVESEVWVIVGGLPCIVQAPEDTVLCPGAVFQLSATEATVTARWYVFHGEDSTAFPNNAFIHPRVTTEFLLMGFNASGEVCSRDTLLITVHPMPDFRILPQPPVYRGTSIHLVSTPNTPIWTDINGERVLMPLTPDSSQYFIAIYQSGSCEISDTIWVEVLDEQPTVLTLEIRSFDGCMQGEGFVEVTVLDGQAPFTFEWTPGPTTTSVNPVNYIENLTPGSYIVTVTDALGATGQAFATIGLVTPLSLTYTMDIAANDSCDDGRITLFVVGGQAPYYFEWINMMLDTTTVVTTAQNLINHPSGFYRVRVTDSRGCSVVQNIVLPCTHEQMMPSVLVTPNNDGFNDYLYIQNIHFFPNNTVTIINSYGAEIITIENYNNLDPNRRWGGRNRRNQYVPDGTYWYVVQAEGVDPMIGWIIVRLSPAR